MIGYNESHDALSVTVGNVSGPSGFLSFKWSHQGRVERRDPLVIPSSMYSAVLQVLFTS